MAKIFTLFIAMSFGAFAVILGVVNKGTTTPEQAQAHTAGYFVSMAFAVIQIISVIMMLTSARNQGLTDAFLGTVMLNQRA